jgi:hypothetical protein
MSYKFIVNPVTNRKVNVFSKVGQQIITDYLMVGSGYEGLAKVMNVDERLLKIAKYYAKRFLEVNSGGYHPTEHDIKKHADKLMPFLEEMDECDWFDVKWLVNNKTSVFAYKHGGITSIFDDLFDPYEYADLDINKYNIYIDDLIMFGEETPTVNNPDWYKQVDVPGFEEFIETGKKF